MLLSTIDLLIIFVFLLISLMIGIYSSRSAGKSSDEYFKGGGKMSWWLLGISMVATTFSTDTPNLVADIVRKHGVSGNWVWWNFLLTGMLTVFFFARLWKRTDILTDIEFYEMRYSGKIAAFLRGFRAIYLGFFFNVMIIAIVSLAAIKISSVLLGLTPVETLLIAGVVTVVYSAIGGLKGVILTDAIQFILSIAGAVIAAFVALSHPEVGGMDNLLKNTAVSERLNIIPDISNPELFLTIFLVPLFIQWWAVWYPGSEPGGGGYMVQRMLSAKNEEHSVRSVLLFNIVHYALRPWPWIVVALCSIVVFPNLEALKTAFPESASIIGDDMAYPAMLSFLPEGAMGLVVTSLLAAYMSTLSTHLNWGSSYLVNDVYARFIDPKSSNKKQVQIGRISTLLIMIAGGIMAILLNNALQGFQILLQIGAGTGLLFILRWYWWRINAATELVAMIVSFLVALYFAFIHESLLHLPALESWQQLIIGVSITTVCWIITAYVSPETDRETLIKFVKKVNPGGSGWTPILKTLSATDRAGIIPKPINFPAALASMSIGTTGIYSLMIGIGKLLLGSPIWGTILLAIAATCLLILLQLRKKL
ncbi:sodium:solute symporter family protein [Robertkochia solimangrovi]|uniref:sodium:solute symporter family protein n=1 Tax=Robertkochia solimangrovi TaxID=2213046 RepID=UPI001181705B|nr:sodium:solute symporter family protein [Robertkochia solimangrovi]TRZ41859.1 Na+:solute symporter [Robertkochia solimangrovi]